MRSKKFILIGLLAVALALAASGLAAAQDETMTNDEVISLTKAGLASTVIIGKIRTSKTNFDMSTDALIKLKQAGVADDAVTAMLEAKSGKSFAVTSGAAIAEVAGDPNDPMAKHGYGIYLFEDSGGEKKMTQLKPNVSAQNRTGGIFSNALTYNISKIKIKADLPGRSADFKIKSPAPVFYFYLDSTSGGLNTSSGIPSDPSEFALVRFALRGKDREMTIGKQNAFGAKGGVSDEYIVQFKAQDMGNGIFKVTPAGDLKTGEYAFYLINSGNSNTSAAVGSKFFDFSLSMTP